MTRIGGFLRCWWLDDLPLGQSETPFEEMVRLDYLYVTGWSPMTDLPFEEMERLDYLYVTSWSLMNDIKLAVRTIPPPLRTRQA